MAADIARDVQLLRERLVEKVPSHFGMRHIVVAFFGALFFGFTFVLKGLLFDVGLQLQKINLILIAFTTLLILTAEIYFVGYTRVPNKSERPFFQFWIKRLLTYYFIAMFTSFLLLSLYNMTALAGSAFNVLKLVVAISFPAAIGAAVSDLLGKY